MAGHAVYDLFVIGGGITGAGTFRDLSLQGLRVLLVERGDFASGASGALTRIAHGGFRYLERGDIALVRDSVIERDRLLANAPHAVKPIRVVLPLADRFKGLVAAPLGFLRLTKTSGLPGTLAMRLAGLLYAGRLHGARYTLGETDLLTVIAAVIVGGTRLNGGTGTVVGALIGSLMMGMLNNGLILMGLSVAEQMMVRGLIILAAVALTLREARR